jgi:hypothetical protein
MCRGRITVTAESGQLSSTWLRINAVNRFPATTTSLLAPDELGVEHYEVREKWE